MQEIVNKNHVSHVSLSRLELEELIKSTLWNETGLQFHPIVEIDGINRKIYVKYCKENDYRGKLVLSEYNDCKVSSIGLLDKIIKSHVALMSNGFNDIDIELLILNSDRVFIVFNSFRTGGLS